MPTISEIFRRSGPEYVERFGGDMPWEHRKVIDATVRCRTEAAGSTWYACEGCGRPHVIYRSCGNRHCPECQHCKTRQWLETQMNRILPGHHVLLTFTVPQELRRFIRSHQRVAYPALLKASAGAMYKLARDPRHIGGSLPAAISTCRSGLCPGSSGPSSGTRCRPRGCWVKSRPESGRRNGT